MTLSGYKFSISLEQGEHPETGLAVFGFVHNGMFIHDPFVSECSRFKVDPPEAYSITWEDADALKELNKALAEATEAAVNAACKSFLDAAGISSGDVAGIFFSDTAASLGFSKAVADYIQFELVQAGNSVS